MTILRELAKAAEPHIKQEDEGKFRCKTCQKLFRATSFVEKHIANKHPELVKHLDDVRDNLTVPMQLLTRFTVTLLQQFCVRSSPHPTVYASSPYRWQCKSSSSTPSLRYTRSCLSWRLRPSWRALSIPTRALPTTAVQWLLGSLCIPIWASGPLSSTPYAPTT